jgi:hypothetical protein
LDCLSVPESRHQELLLEITERTRAPYAGESAGASAGPEAGNLALFEVFRFFPCSAAELTGATDYFPLKVCQAVGLRTLAHKRRVSHRHTACRYDEFAKLRDYWVVVANLVDYLCAYRPLFERLAGLSLGRLFSLDPEAVARTIADELAATATQLQAQLSARTAKQSTLERLLRQFGDDSHARIATQLAAGRTQRLAAMPENCLAHARLIHAWPKLVRAAREVRPAAVRDAFGWTLTDRGHSP